MLNFRSFIWNNPYAKELPSLPVWPLACCCVDKLCCGLLLLLTRCRHTAGSHLLTSCFPNTKEGKILFHGHAQTFSKPDLALLQQICIILTEMYQTQACVSIYGFTATTCVTCHLPITRSVVQLRATAIYMSKYHWARYLTYWIHRWKPTKVSTYGSIGM